MSAEAIARGLGLKRSGHEFVGACPSCKYKSGFSITERDGKPLVYCAAGALSPPDLWAALIKLGLVRDDCEERRPPRRWRRNAAKATPRQGAATGATTTEQAMKLWRRTDPDDGTVNRYLISRGIVDDILIDNIRYLARCKHRSGVKAPAMIGLIEHVEHGPIATHRTWLREDGSGKADLDPVKMTMGPRTGGAIQLMPIGPDGKLAV